MMSIVLFNQNFYSVKDIFLLKIACIFFILDTDIMLNVLLFFLPTFNVKLY